MPPKRRGKPTRQVEQAVVRILFSAPSLRLSKVVRLTVTYGAAIALSRTSVCASITTPCALSSPATDQPPCSPYIVTPARIIATFTRNNFNGMYDPDALATLSDGSAVVAEAPYALFRIHSGGVGVMWAPAGSRYYLPTNNIWIARPGATPGVYYSGPHTRVWINESPPPPTPTPAPESVYFYLLGSLGNTVLIQYGDNWIYGLSLDGDVAFRFPLAGADLVDRPTFFGRDPDGALWFESASGRSRRNTIYAFYPGSKKLLVLSEPVENLFQGPSGFIYATLGKNLVKLTSNPKAQARFSRGPIVVKQGDLGGGFDIPVSRIGADGSAWASTSDYVIHEHPNGQVSEIRLARTPLTISFLPRPIQINLAPDGSNWSTATNKLVRITKDDRVEVMNIPNVRALGWFPEAPHLSPDNTVWLKTFDSPTAITHIAPPRD